MPKLKFLIVEDDLFYQTYVNDLLAETGVDIINAVDGEAGLALAKAEKPDLIITDIEIPKIQGFVFFKSLREQPETKNIPVIMMSGKVEKALLDRHSALSVHAEGYLVKPFSGQILIEMIRDVIGEDFGYSEVDITDDAVISEKYPAPDGEDSAPEVEHFPGKKPGDVREGGPLTVLIVDDSRYICDITKDFLEELGVKTEIASDGETGYQMACDLLPDLILLDVQMPNMNGFVVCEMLRKREETKNLPIILMSAVVDDESFQRHSKLRYHADAYLQKPFMKSELHELVHRFTSFRDQVPTDLESKTGFFVPSEEEGETGDTDEQMPGVNDLKLVEDLEQSRIELQAAAERHSQLEAEIDSVKKEKDNLEAEIFELKKTAGGNESGLQDKLILATQRFEEARSESEKLAEENRALQTRLDDFNPNDALSEKIGALEGELKETREALALKERENEELGTRLQETEANQELKDQIMELGAKLQEASAVALEMENRNKLLEEETLKLRKQVIADESSSEGSSDQEELLSRIEALSRDLAAATAAKKEIEDQAKLLFESGETSEEADRYKKELEKTREENKELLSRVSQVEAQVLQHDDLQAQLVKERSESEELRKKLADLSEDPGTELDTLKDKLSAALQKAESLEGERDNLSDALKDLEHLKEHDSELQKHVEGLKEEIEENQKLAARETQARMDLEGKLDSKENERKLLEVELEEAKRQLDEQEEAEDSVTELENRFEVEKGLRAAAEEELKVLRRELEQAAASDEKARQLEKDNHELESALNQARKRFELLEKEVEAGGSLRNGESPEAQIDAPHWEKRFNQLEEALDKTVSEAQTILKEQKDRESALEDSVESLMRSLEEERSVYRKEREDWNAKEGELRDAFEDALKESRRLMGEEAARLYPMLMPRQNRPLEVVTRTSKYGIAAAAVVLVLVVFAGGYFLRPKTSSNSSPAILPAAGQSAPAGPHASGNMPVEPWVASSGPEDGYEELWRQNTVQSVSDDMMIQATLHTRDELEAAIKYTAKKEGWTLERIHKAMADMARTYNLSDAFYVTVYSKNLKGGYPGYADSFEQHIALRDQSGREVRAYFPGELEGSKFITSRVSAAGKEMNPVFLYEVGLTVAFARKGLADKPEGLQLVLYDIGAVPMRVLTWDMTGLGSLSHNDSVLKVVADS
jgi:DNA-binding response OmpR family regulator